MSGKRTDGNQKAIKLAVFRFGYSVHSTHEEGKGFPDLVFGGPCRAPTAASDSHKTE